MPFNRPLLRARNEGHHVWLLGANGALLQQSLIGTAVPQLTGENELVHSYRLEQNYPNPFNPSTSITVHCGQRQVSGRPDSRSSRRQDRSARCHDVKLTVYDLLGREVAVLVNERKPAGSYEISFDANGLASGVYYYRLTARPTDGGQAGAFTQSRTMVLVK